MSPLIRSIAIGLLFVAPSHALAKADLDEIRAAQQQVNDYRQLRRNCTSLSLERKHACYSELNAKTRDYKEAKRFLAMNKSDAQDLLSFAK